MHVMQILCSEICAGFPTNVSSDEGLCVLYISLLNYKAMISNYTQQVPSSKACSFSGSQ